MAELMNRAVVLKHRPVGIPTVDDFDMVEYPLQALQAGEVLVRNLYMSVDPYMRGRMRDRKGYTSSFQLGELLDGGCVGVVVESKHPHLKVGDHVLGNSGWREFFHSDGQGLLPVDPHRVPLQAYLGVMGMPGMTAYVGLLDIGKPQPGETVFVSAASGAVGSVVCQIARIKDCRVVGSAGSDQKVAWLLEEAGVDVAFNYKQANDLSATLGSHCPDGIDVYFENVGGEHLEAALTHMNQNGRIPLCGMISMYNQEGPTTGIRNLVLAVGKRLILQGFIVSDHYDRLPQFLVEMGEWIAEGSVRYQETVYKGLEAAPQAFIGLFTGANFGKMLVEL